MTSRSIDHLVLTVADLDAAADAFTRLGFTLTPRAEHPWGTSNRLIQFKDRSFIEILTLDRPHLLVEHDLSSAQPKFSFGAFNRDFLAAGRTGLSMCAFVGDDSLSDASRFADAGLSPYAPFDFGRTATLPDGTQVAVAFSLAFARLPSLPDITLFTCHNRYPQNFWKAPFQHHANGASGLGTVALQAHDVETAARYVATVASAPIERAAHGYTVGCGQHHVRVTSLPAAERVSSALTGLTVLGTTRRDTHAIAGTQLAFT